MNHDVTAKPRKSYTLILIITGNIIPLIGVLFFHWDLDQVVILYWIENLIIGFWNIPRILLAGKPPTTPKLPLAIFFIVHYGMFCFGHGMFIAVLVNSSETRMIIGPSAILDLISKGVVTGAIIMFFSAGWDFFQTYIRNEEYKNWRPTRAMGYPYGHIVVIHIAIIFTGAITMLFGTPIVLLLLLIIGKIILEYGIKSGKFSLRKLIRR